MLDQLPTSLQHVLMLEWISPEAVWTLARANAALRRTVLLTPPTQTYRAGTAGTVLSDACVRWFKKHGELTLRLWTECCIINHTEHYITNGKMHRDGDLPAVVRADGHCEWWQHNKVHRDGDLPAKIWSDGTQEWYQNGMLHRDGDLPARIWASGEQQWFKRGEHHRDGNQPVHVSPAGIMLWWRNGEFCFQPA